MTREQFSLDGLEQAALILRSDAGVLYETQTGGIRCWSKRARGILLPITNDVPFVRYQKEALMFVLRKATGGLTMLDERVASKIEKCIGPAVAPDIVTVDRTLLSESHEAWVYVMFEYAGDGLVQTPGGLKFEAVLTWPNSH